MKSLRILLTLLCLTFVGNTAIAQEYNPGHAAKSAQVQAVQDILSFWLTAGVVGGITRAMMAGLGSTSLGHATTCHH